MRCIAPQLSQTRRACARRWAQQVTANITPPSQLGCVLTQFPIDPEAFSAQILRSCDSRSALFDPAREGHLHCKKGRSVDRSIYLVRPCLPFLLVFACSHPQARISHVPLGHGTFFRACLVLELPGTTLCTQPPQAKEPTRQGTNVT